MAVKITNTSSGKIIGIGNVTVLPGETSVIPDSYANNPSLLAYKKIGHITIKGTPDSSKKVEEKKEVVNEDNDMKELRKSQLKALGKMSADDIGKLANELGINPADCKDDEALKKAVKAELKKLSE